MARVADLVARFERGRRFWRNVDVGERRACWIWDGATDGHGHARFGSGPADVHAYQLVRGPLARGARLEHSCGNDRCVNPEHMRVVEAPAS
jgi:hypothetical protein